MARAEKLYTDQAIQTELDTYNPLISGPGRLSATLLIELTSRAELEHWLPRLLAIEQSVQLVIGSGTGAVTVRAEVDESHAANLTREEVTASVHFLHFPLNPAQVGRFQRETVNLIADHPEYCEQAPLRANTKASLLQDLLG